MARATGVPCSLAAALSPRRPQDPLRLGARMLSLHSEPPEERQ